MSLLLNFIHGVVILRVVVLIDDFFKGLETANDTVLVLAYLDLFILFNEPSVLRRVRFRLHRFLELV